MIQGINMNLDIFQCKNCWKWNHITFTCYTYSSKYVKCNGSYKVKHYSKMVWCCKMNFKTNLLKLEIKKGELYLHFFKCINYKEEHQANSNTCSFWKHWFNKSWHSKKYQKLCKNRSKSICLVVSKESI